MTPPDDKTRRVPTDVVAKVRAPSADVLEMTKGPRAPRSIALKRDSLVFGRIETADVFIDADSVSRRHFQLTRQDEEWTATDLGSANGIFLNGVRVNAAVLRDGDQLQAGDVVFVFREGT